MISVQRKTDFIREATYIYIFEVILVSIIVQLGMPVNVAASYIKHELNLKEKRS